MQITKGITQLKLVLETGGSYHRIVQRFCSRHFKNALHLSNALIVFYEEKEKEKRMLFLEWVVKNASFNDLDSNLAKYIKLPLRIKFDCPNAIRKTYNINLCIVSKNSIEIKVENEVFVFYFEGFFGKNILEQTEHSLKIPTKISCLKQLRALMQKKVIFGSFINFVYDKIRWKKLFDQLDQKLKPRKTFFYFQDPMEQNLKVLNCTSKSSYQEIKQSYLKLIKIYHPDKVYNKDEETIKAYTKKFQEISLAYSFIQKHRKFVA